MGAVRRRKSEAKTWEALPKDLAPRSESLEARIALAKAVSRNGLGKPYSNEIEEKNGRSYPSNNLAGGRLTIERLAQADVPFAVELADKIHGYDFDQEDGLQKAIQFVREIDADFKAVIVQSSPIGYYSDENRGNRAHVFLQVTGSRQAQRYNEAAKLFGAANQKSIRPPMTAHRFGRRAAGSLYQITEDEALRRLTLEPYALMLRHQWPKGDQYKDADGKDHDRSRNVRIRHHAHQAINKGLTFDQWASDVINARYGLGARLYERYTNREDMVIELRTHWEACTKRGQRSNGLSESASLWLLEVTKFYGQGKGITQTAEQVAKRMSQRGTTLTHLAVRNFIEGSPITIARRLKKLSQDGFLRVIPNVSKNPNNAQEYELWLPDFKTLGAQIEPKDVRNRFFPDLLQNLLKERETLQPDTRFRREASGGVCNSVYQLIELRNAFSPKMEYAFLEVDRLGEVTASQFKEAAGYTRLESAYAMLTRLVKVGALEKVGKVYRVRPEVKEDFEGYRKQRAPIAKTEKRRERNNADRERFSKIDEYRTEQIISVIEANPGIDVEGILYLLAPKREGKGDAKEKREKAILKRLTNLQTEGRLEIIHGSYYLPVMIVDQPDTEGGKKTPRSRPVRLTVIEQPDKEVLEKVTDQPPSPSEIASKIRIL